MPWLLGCLAGGAYGFVPGGNRCVGGMGGGEGEGGGGRGGEQRGEGGGAGESAVVYGDTLAAPTCFRRNSGSQLSALQLSPHSTYLHSHSLAFPVQHPPTSMSVPWRKNTHIPSPPSYPSSFGTADSDVDSGSDSGDTDAELDAIVQEEWEESLRQMEVVISIIVIPYFGKWFGRQWAFWGTSRRQQCMIELTSRAAYERYQQIGLGRTFFGLS